MMFLMFVLFGLFVQDGELTYERAYEEHLRGKPMLVLCGAEWCGPCQKMKTTLKDMKERGDLENLAVAYVDIDKQPELFEKMKVGNSVPQVHYFVKGRKLSLKGIQDRIRLKRLFKDLQ